jgi:hypothetical protein
VKQPNSQKRFEDHGGGAKCQTKFETQDQTFDKNKYIVEKYPIKVDPKGLDGE